MDLCKVALRDRREGPSIYSSNRNPMTTCVIAAHRMGQNANEREVHPGELLAEIVETETLTKHTGALLPTLSALKTSFSQRS